MAAPFLVHIDITTMLSDAAFFVSEGRRNDSAASHWRIEAGDSCRRKSR